MKYLSMIRFTCWACIWKEQEESTMQRMHKPIVQLEYCQDPIQDMSLELLELQQQQLQQK